MMIIVGAFSALGYKIYTREEEVLLIRDKCDYGYATPTGEIKHCMDVDECSHEEACPRSLIPTIRTSFILERLEIALSRQEMSK